MSIRHALLALLSDRPKYGLQLRQDFEARTGEMWPLTVGQVYSTLQRLERDGLVHAASDAARTAQGAGATQRTDYRITATGRRQLEQWFGSPVVPEGAGRDELTIKVLLAVAASDIDVTEVLQRQRTATLGQLQAYTRRKARADPEPELALVMMLDALIFKAEAEVRWLDACEARIKRRAGGK